MTSQHSRIEIPLSKKKIIMVLIGAVVFVVLGTWFVMRPDTFSSGGLLRNPVVVTVVGIAAIAFFGFCAFYAIRKLGDNKPGLIVDETGITDNSSGVSAGHVLWTDINGLSTISIQRQQFILLHVNNPMDYIDRQSGGLKKKMMQLNFKLYGSPLTIGANSLKISFDDLHRLINERVPARP